jgi:maltose/moltooligosaccharide transporter
LSKLATKIGRKVIYSFSLLAGSIGFFSLYFLTNPELVIVNFGFSQIEVPQGAVNLFIPMIGVGMAWAAILAMPYAILAGSLPIKQTGVYMGIFNFTIAAPQIVSGIFAGWILTSVFDDQAIYIMMLAAIAMLLAAISVYFVKDNISDGPIKKEVVS